MKPPLPLAGVRILDLSRLLPGPFATLVLADLGADVIKVEDPRGGDPVRALPPFTAPGGESAAFLALNRNKRSLALELRAPAGR
ncbi:MAG TPA: CoA transferase, partial [Myxococcaceae bacterium]|nr:CoA transferase [Myxococcaceae bacterium]